MYGPVVHDRFKERLTSLRHHLCRLNLRVTASEFKNFRRFVLFRVNKERRDLAPTLNGFFDVIKSASDAFIALFQHFDDVAKERADWPLEKRLEAVDWDWGLFSVSTDMLKIKKPDSAAKTSLRLALKIMKVLR